MNNDNSGVNTILIVIVLLLLVGFGVWYLTDGFNAWRAAPAENDNAEFNLNVEIPAGSNDEGGGQ